MNITFEAPDKITGLLTLTIGKDDYQADVDKTLKSYQKAASVPGFRKGKAPMDMIKRTYGASAKLDVIDRLVAENVTKYISDNKIQMLGKPLASTKQQSIDPQEETLTFCFDIAVAPEFKAELTEADTIDYYDITVDDKAVDDEVDGLRRHYGKLEDAQTYSNDMYDMLYGDFHELDAQGNALEGGITAENVSLMPYYIEDEEQKKLFDSAAVGSVITMNPSKASRSESDLASMLKITTEQAAEAKGDFTYQITKITRFAKAEVGQKLFDEVYGEGNVTDEKTFREKLTADLKARYEMEADHRFLTDMRKYIEEKVGELTFADDVLKRIMIAGMKDKTAEEAQKAVDEEYDASIKALKWHLIKEQLVSANNIKIEDDDITAAAKDYAKAVFAQYGMNNMSEEYINNYAQQMIKDGKHIDMLIDQAIEKKLTAVIKGKVKLNKKAVTTEEFYK